MQGDRLRLLHFFVIFFELIKFFLKKVFFFSELYVIIVAEDKVGKDTKEWSCFLMNKFLDAILSLALVAGLGFWGYYIVSTGTVIDQTTTYYDPDSQPVTEEPAKPETQSNLDFEYEEVPNTAVHDSPLMLVNSNFACTAEESNLVSLDMKRMEVGSNSFSVDENLYVREIMADALIRMLDDYNVTKQQDNIIVSAGYRTEEEQQRLYEEAQQEQELYEEDLEETGTDYSETVSPAGYSEYQTGWCVDLAIDGEGEFDGTDEQSWILENCYRYGIIVRYPQEKTDITGMPYTPNHLRYVGFPHATIMAKENKTLEEYIDFVKDYPFGGSPLRISDYDAKIYEVFYYPMNEESDTTSVPIPIGLDYEICGNNIDGFIVTIDTGEIDHSQPPAEEEIPEDADPERPKDWSEDQEFEADNEELEENEE